MVVRKVDAHIFDVFMGKGWDNWVRVKTHRSPTGNRISIIKSAIHVNKIEKDEIEALFNTQH